MTPVRPVLFDALESAVAGERVLVLVPDHTRVLPLDEVLPALADALHRAQRVEVMVALGTHPPEPPEHLRSIAALIRAPAVNHDWQDERVLQSIGTIGADRIRVIAGPVWHPSLERDLEVRINRAATEADRVVVVGPTLPHEVAGFSGGTKYLFPGISGPEMIDVMHWVGALSGVMATIGRADTPVRSLIDEAAALLATPVTLVAAVTDERGLAGVYAGPPEETWRRSVEHADRLHVTVVDRPFERVVSSPLPIYEELWTAAKAVYKLEPAVADGGELIVYAPWLSEVSRTHGSRIFEVGYHVMDYFLKQWDRFAEVPLAVLAHSTHVKGAGSYDGGREVPRITVRLATGISAADCERLNLGYTDPRTIDLESPPPGTFVVPDAGEHLWRLP